MAFHSYLSDYLDWTQKRGNLEFPGLRWLLLNVEITMGEGVKRQ